MSRPTPAKSDRTRQRILDAAAELFREQGMERVGVRDVMKHAGLTRGGFYFHFTDKDSLFAEATQQAARSNAASHSRWAQEAEKGRKLQAFIEQYLSEEHRDNPKVGCILAALGSEIGRSGELQRKAFTEGADIIVEQIATFFPGPNAAEQKMRAELLIASMAGVLIACRAMSDRASSNALLASARQFYSTTFAGA